MSDSASRPAHASRKRKSGAEEPAAVPTGPALDPDACRACGGVTTRRGNLFLLCDGCDGTFHQRCVGLGGAPPADDWFCAACTAAPGGASARGRGRRVSEPAAASPGSAAEARGKRGRSLESAGTASASDSDGDDATVGGGGAKRARRNGAAEGGSSGAGVSRAADAADAAAEAVGSMRVPELRAALVARGLDAGGLKSALVARLSAAMAQEAAAAAAAAAPSPAQSGSAPASGSRTARGRK